MIEHMPQLRSPQPGGLVLSSPGRLRLTAGLLVLSGLLVACQGDDRSRARAGSSTAAPTPSAATTPAPGNVEPAPGGATTPAPGVATPPAPRSVPGVTASAGVTVSAQASDVAVDCHTFAMSLSAGAKGLSTPQRAIEAFIRSGRASFALPPSGWEGPAGVGRFTSGRASVTVVAVPRAAGYLVDSATSC